MSGHAASAMITRLHRVAGALHRDERGQSLAVVLALVTLLFLLGTALAVQASTALRVTAASDGQADALHAADAGAELGIWWQRNGQAGNPPAITINGLTVSTTVSVAPPPGGSGAGWQQWGWNGRSQATTSAPGPASYNARWSTFPTLAQGTPVASATVAADGYVYVGATTGLYAYRPDGQLAWSFLSAGQIPAVGTFSGSPAILTTGGGAKMIVAATDGAAATASKVFGLTEDAAKTGVSITWSYSLGNGAGVGFVGGAKLNVAGTRAYLAARNSTVYAFDTTAAGNNPPLWSSATGGAAAVPVALNVAEDRVYVATSTGIVRAYDATTGAQSWTRTVSAGAVLTAPVFHDTGARNHVYVGTGANSTIRAIRDLGNSSGQDWSVALGANAFSAPVLATSGSQEFVFVADSAGGIRKLEDLGNSAATRWTYTPVASPIQSGLAMDSAGFLYLGNDAGSLYRIADNGASGSTSWTQAVGLGAVRSEIVVGTDGDLYAVTAGNRMVAVGGAAPGGLATVTATAGAATVTTTYTDVGAGVPTLSSWTTTK